MLTFRANLPEDQFMSDEARTKPTIETVLERINALAEEMRAGFAAINQRLERTEIRIDRLESMALETRADVRELRLEFNEFRVQFKLPAT